MSRIIFEEEKTLPDATKTKKTIAENLEFERILLEEKLGKKEDDLKNAMQSGDYSAIKDRIQTAVQTSVEPKVEKMKIANKKHVSLKLGVVGSGQAGGRMAEVFHNFGYDACAVNTAKQDLEFLSLPDARKLVVEYTLSGSGKDIEIGQAAIDANRDAVATFITGVIGECDVAVLTLSLGGGSGSGSAVPMVEILGGLGKPLLVLAALPGSFDDSQSRFNAMQTLGKLADLSGRGVINSLIVIDNAKIENSYPNLSQAQFFDVSNRSVIEPLHLFNQVTAMPSNLEVMDAMDLTRALLEAGSCSLFGSMKVTAEEYSGDESALLSAMVAKLPDALPANDFDLKEAQAVGVLVTAKQEVLDAMPYANIAYLFKYVSDEFDSARSFKGVYALPSESDDIQISFIFSGMGLPARRVDELKADAAKHVAKMEEKKKKTAAGMVVSGQKGPVSQADRMIAKVKQQNSAVGKLLGNMGKVDRKR